MNLRNLTPEQAKVLSPEQVKNLSIKQLNILLFLSVDLPFPVEILNLVRDVLKDKRNSIGTFSTWPSGRVPRACPGESINTALSI